MSVWIVSKVDIDALVTIALRWSEGGELARMPEPAADALRVTAGTATEVGRRLWQANHDAFSYGGPPELCDAEMRAQIEAFGEDVEVMPDYVFEALPGVPAPLIALRRAHYYRYQTAGDHWTTDDVRSEAGADTGPPFEARFTAAVEWYGLVQLGLADPASTPHPPGERPDVDLTVFPAYELSGWHLGEADRDLFLRFGG